MVENKLFATLDPTHRRLRLPSLDVTRNEAVILTDTVGFIRDLPEELMTAFKATLDELNEAVLFLHVLDASDPLIAERKKNVEKILSEMKLIDVPSLIVLNKCDRINSEIKESLMAEFDGVCVSATTGVGCDTLLKKIVSTLGEIGKRRAQQLKKAQGS